ncbi:MAG: response regulator transcription factor [Sphingobacteriales bacterium]|nr:MAG: response regulator transcription factor [Sphingobacteriales bacterium]
MISAIIVDDEKNAREVLDWQVKTFCPQVQVKALCADADEGIQTIQELRPDLVFLDIEMPVKNGFELLNAFPQPSFNVIFTTAYNQFAIKAFKYAAFDYLVKPIEDTDLRDAVKRYEQRQQGSISDQVKKLMGEYQKASLGRIALPIGDGLMMVKPDQIIRCQSVSNYTTIILESGRKLMASKTLKEVEEILSGFCFYRIHQSHLVNLNHVQSFMRTDGGYVLMSDGEKITIARHRREGFIEQFSRI